MLATVPVTASREKHKVGDESDDLIRIGAGGRLPDSIEVPNLAGVAWCLWLASSTFSIMASHKSSKGLGKNAKVTMSMRKQRDAVLKNLYRLVLRHQKRDILVYLYLETKYLISGDGYTICQYHTSSSEEFLFRLGMHLSRFGLDKCIYKSSGPTLPQKPFNTISKTDQYWIYLIVLSLIKIDDHDRSKQAVSEQHGEEDLDFLLPISRQTGGGVHRACWFARKYSHDDHRLLGPDALYALWLKYKSISNLLYACEVHGLYVELLRRARLGGRQTNGVEKAGSIAKLASVTKDRLKAINPIGVKKGASVVDGDMFDPRRSMLYETPLCRRAFNQGIDFEMPEMNDEEVARYHDYRSSLRKDALI